MEQPLGSLTLGVTAEEHAPRPCLHLIGAQAEPGTAQPSAPVGRQQDPVVLGWGPVFWGPPSP